MGPCYVIAYDPEEGFDAEERTIRIMAQREAGTGVMLRWDGSACRGASEQRPRANTRARAAAGCQACVRMSASSHTQPAGLLPVGVCGHQTHPHYRTRCTGGRAADDLVDLEDGDPLHWRREGERWEPPEEEMAR